MSDEREVTPEEKRALDLVAASAFRELADHLEFGTPMSPAADAWFSGLHGVMKADK